MVISNTNSNKPAHPNLRTDRYHQNPIKQPKTPTDYRLEPDTTDPAEVTAWRLKRHPRGLTLTNRKPIWAPLFFIALILALGGTPFLIHELGLLDLGGVQYLIAGFATLLLAFAIYLLITTHRNHTPKTVLDHDTMADTLKLHDKTIDPDTALAVERITFFFGFKPPKDDKSHKRDERGGRYTTKTLLVLKTKLPHPNDTHPSSNQPGTRYHLIAATHMGLRNTGKPIAKSLHVPYSHSSLGTFVKTIRTTEDALEAAATI